MLTYTLVSRIRLLTLNTSKENDFMTKSCETAARIIISNPQEPLQRGLTIGPSINPFIQKNPQAYLLMNSIMAPTASNLLPSTLPNGQVPGLLHAAPPSTALPGLLHAAPPGTAPTAVPASAYMPGVPLPAPNAVPIVTPTPSAVLSTPAPNTVLPTPAANALSLPKPTQPANDMME